MNRRAYRDLNKFRATRNRWKKNWRERYNYAIARQRSYSKADELLIRLHIIPDRWLAKILKRGIGAIQVRRSVIKSRGGRSA